MIILLVFQSGDEIKYNIVLKCLKNINSSGPIGLYAYNRAKAKQKGDKTTSFMVRTEKSPPARSCTKLPFRHKYVE